MCELIDLLRKEARDLRKGFSYDLELSFDCSLQHAVLLIVDEGLDAGEQENLTAGLTDIHK